MCSPIPPPRLLLTLALVLSSLFSPPPLHAQNPSPPPAQTTSASLGPLQVAQLFWEAMKNADTGRLQTHVGYPFTWDAKCRIFRSFSEIEAAYRRNPKPPKELRFEDFQFLDPSQKAIPPPFASLLKNLHHIQTCNSPSLDLLLRQIETYKSVFVSFHIRIGKNDIPTLTRLSWLQGEWKVTGFDN